MIVRIFDTRLYHEFGSNTILRDFTHLEATYEHLESVGYSFQGKSIPVENQSDDVYPHLLTLAKYYD